MVVNVNQCASTYDETCHVMKFSAIAKQVKSDFPYFGGTSLHAFFIRTIS